MKLTEDERWGLIVGMVVSWAFGMPWQWLPVLLLALLVCVFVARIINDLDRSSRR